METARSAALDAAARAADEEQQVGDAAAEAETGASASSSGSWKTGLGALVAGGATAVASAAVNFFKPLPLASRPASVFATASNFTAHPPPGPGPLPASAALKSSWIMRLRGALPTDSPATPAPVSPAPDSPAPASAAERPAPAQSRSPAGLAGMDLDSGARFTSAMLTPSGDGHARTPVATWRFGDGQQQQQQEQAASPAILSRRQASPVSLATGVAGGGGGCAAAAAAGAASGSGLGRRDKGAVGGDDMDDTVRMASRSRNGIRASSPTSSRLPFSQRPPRVTFSPCTKEAGGAAAAAAQSSGAGAGAGAGGGRGEFRKRHAAEAELEGRHPFTFPPADAILNDVAPEAPIHGFGAFRLSAAPPPTTAAAPSSMGPPTKRVAVAGARNGAGSFAFSAAAAAGKGSVPQATVVAVAVAAAEGAEATGEVTALKPRTERKASFQLLKSDITKEEETERLQRRNGQLLESMLASRQGKDVFKVRSGSRSVSVASEGLPPRAVRGAEGHIFGFVPFVKNVVSDGHYGGPGQSDTLGRPGKTFEPTGSMDGATLGLGAAGTRQGKEVFQETDMGAARPSQRHADTLSQLWQGIAEQPSLLTPLFAPYKPSQDSSEEQRAGGSGSKERADLPPPLTPIFSPFKYAQDDASRAPSSARPSMSRRLDPSPSPSAAPFPFSAAAKRLPLGPKTAGSPFPAPPLPGEGLRSDDQVFGADPSRTLRKESASADTRSKFQSQSSHFSSSPFEGPSAGLQIDDAGSRYPANRSGKAQSNIPSSSTWVRGFGSSDAGSAFETRKHTLPQSHAQGGTNSDIRFKAGGDSDMPFRPADQDVSTFKDTVPIRHGSQKQGVVGGGNVGEAGEGPSFCVSERAARQGRRNILNEVDSAGPSYISSRSLHQSSKKPRGFQLQAGRADGAAEVGSESKDNAEQEEGPSDRTKVSQVWINRWLPSNSALPACQPSNSKSSASPAAGARPSSARAPVTNIPVSSSGNVRISSYGDLDRPSGSRRRADEHTGFEYGPDRWFHARTATGSPAPPGPPSAAAMAIVGRASRNLTTPAPLLPRQGVSSVWSSSGSQASAAGPSRKKQPR